MEIESSGETIIMIDKLIILQPCGFNVEMNWNRISQSGGDFNRLINPGHPLIEI